MSLSRDPSCRDSFSHPRKQWRTDVLPEIGRYQVDNALLDLTGTKKMEPHLNIPKKIHLCGVQPEVTLRFQTEQLDSLSRSAIG
jgi:hypothetical protein